jgi:putative ABC transport system permease protein
VVSATFSTNVPLFGGGFGRTVFVEGQEEPPGGNGAFVTTNVVGPKYFSTLSIPIRQGRDFLPDDRPGGRRVAIVNQSMVRRFWPKGNALGARFHFFGGEVVEIVGIAADSAIVDVTGSSQTCAYLPFSQNYSEYATLQVRTSGNPAPVVGLLRKEIRAIDEQLPLIQATTMSRIVEDALWAPRMATRLLAVFGALALVLAAIGLYGVVAYTASQRTREIGVRIAMGAGPREVFRLVVGGALSMTGAGMVLGIAAGLALARAMSSLLFGVGAMDLVTFVVVPLVLGGVSFLASALPARQATRVDPILALRSE